MRVRHTGLTPNSYDMESSSLPFCDKALPGVEALIRDLI
jgi:hypothetical protein